jgi:hypothetical protein
VTDTVPEGRPGAKRLSGLPELWFGVFGLLLHYPWEFLQVPFFERMPELPHWEAVKVCTQAALGDAVITIVAFWVAALAVQSRGWFWRPRPAAWIAYLAAGILVTLGLEWLATDVLDRWQYAAEMPRMPLLGTGLLPIVQWLLLPPLVLGLARGQLRGLGGAPQNGNNSGTTTGVATEITS